VGQRGLRGARKPLKTTLITVADTKSNPMLASAVMAGTSSSTAS
jgi:hypothetical protein